MQFAGLDAAGTGQQLGLEVELSGRHLGRV